jgi:hypothetical protein
METKMVKFADAKVVAAKAPKKEKATKPHHELTGLLKFAAIKNAIESLETLKTTFEQQVKGQMLKHFINSGAETGTKPANFEGSDGLATASCELRKRSVKSILSLEDKTLLTDYNIPVEEVKSDIETYIINPAYLADTKLMSKVEAALNKIVGMPIDFIMKQEAVTTYTVSDATVDAVFALKDKAKLEKLAPIVTTLAIKSKLDNDNIVAETVRTLLLGEKK